MKKILSIALLCSSLTAQLYAVDVETGYRAMLVEGREWIYKELLPDYESMTEEQIRNRIRGRFCDHFCVYCFEV